MTDGADFGRALGHLEGQMVILLKEIEKTAKQIETNRAESKQDRAGIYSELKDLREASHDVKADLSSLVKQMEVDKKIVGELQQWKQRVIGMRMLASVQIAVAVFSLSAVMSVVMKWVGKKMGLD